MWCSCPKMASLMMMLVVLMVTSQVRVSYAGGAADNIRLHDEMFKDYNTAVRPSRDYSKPIEVDIQVFVFALIALNMPEQYIHLTGMMKVNWRDELLVWEPADYGNISSMLVGQDDVWRPDIVFADSRHEEGEIYMGSENVRCEVDHDGMVTWQPSYNMKFACKVDSTKYPFDEDFCSFKVAQNMDDKTRIKLNPLPMNFSRILHNGNFHLDYHKVITDTYSEDINGKVEEFDTLTFKMKVQRKPQYDALTLLLPLLLISLLCIIPYLFKPDNPDKFGIASGLLLSFTVFLDVLHANLPESSENIGILALYVSAMIILAFMASLGNGIVFAYWCWEEDAKKEKEEMDAANGGGAVTDGPASKSEAITVAGDGTLRNRWPWFLRFKGEDGPTVMNNVFLFMHLVCFLVCNIILFAVYATPSHHDEEH